MLLLKLYSVHCSTFAAIQTSEITSWIKSVALCFAYLVQQEALAVSGLGQVLHWSRFELQNIQEIFKLYIWYFSLCCASRTLATFPTKCVQGWRASKEYIGGFHLCYKNFLFELKNIRKLKDYRAGRNKRFTKLYSSGAFLTTELLRK